MITIVYVPTQTRHAVYASGGPGDGSLYGFATQCNREIEDLDKWQEVEAAVTCVNCKRSIAAYAKASEHHD